MPHRVQRPSAARRGQSSRSSRRSGSDAWQLFARNAARASVSRDERSFTEGIVQVEVALAVRRSGRHGARRIFHPQKPARAKTKRMEQEPINDAARKDHRSQGRDGGASSRRSVLSSAAGGDVAVWKTGTGNGFFPGSSSSGCSSSCQCAETLPSQQAMFTG